MFLAASIVKWPPNWCDIQIRLTNLTKYSVSETFQQLIHNFNNPKFTHYAAAVWLSASLMTVVILFQSIVLNEGPLYFLRGAWMGVFSLREAWMRIYFFRDSWIYIFSSSGNWFSIFSWSVKNALTYAWFVNHRLLWE